MVRWGLEVACDPSHLHNFLEVAVDHGRSPVVVGRNIGLDHIGLVGPRNRPEGGLEGDESHWRTMSAAFSKRTR